MTPVDPPATPVWPGQTSGQVAMVWNPWSRTTPDKVQILEGEDTDRWMVVENPLFWTSVRLHVPRIIDFKLFINLTEWGTNLEFLKKKSCDTCALICREWHPLFIEERGVEDSGKALFSSLFLPFLSPSLLPSLSVSHIFLPINLVYMYKMKCDFT